MAVRLTQSRQDDSYDAPAVRQSVGRTLRNRFGFSLIQAPLRTLSPFGVPDFEMSEQRYRRDRQLVLARPSRPLDEELGLGLLLRSRPVARRV